jgi:hypothetical protein
MNETDHPIFQSLTDFNWYKSSLDVASRYHFRHRGEPKKYPCKLLHSEFDSDSNGPDGYNHSFIYLQEVKCPMCEHKEFVWPQIEDET